VDCGTLLPSGNLCDGGIVICRVKKQYYVNLYKFRTFSDGGCSNFIATPSLARARYYAKKLKLKHRQIDVREWGKKAYVLDKSWL
jgi:hypothetical protein